MSDTSQTSSRTSSARDRDIPKHGDLVKYNYAVAGQSVFAVVTGPVRLDIYADT